jgi:hypothetical protein
MDVDLQRRLVPLFHYAIDPDGYLFPGGSETISDADDLFAPVDKKWRLFKRLGTVTPRARLTPPPLTPVASSSYATTARVSICSLQGTSSARSNVCTRTESTRASASVLPSHSGS